MQWKNKGLEKINKIVIICKEQYRLYGKIKENLKLLRQSNKSSGRLLDTYYLNVI